MILHVVLSGRKMNGSGRSFEEVLVLSPEPLVQKTDDFVCRHLRAGFGCV